MKRRELTQAGFTTASLVIAAKAGLVLPMKVLASDWPTDTFHATSFEAALHSVFGQDEIVPSEAVQIDAAEHAENGATVPVLIQTSLTTPFVLTLFAMKNPFPAIGRFEVADSLEGHISTRIKMAESGDVLAVVTKSDKHYSAQRHIRFVAGGCA